MDLRQRVAESFEVMVFFRFVAPDSARMWLQYLFPLLFGGICVFKDANIIHAILLKCFIQTHGFKHRQTSRSC